MTEKIALPNFAELTPAYGRDYKSARAATADFKAGKDFVYHGIGGSTYTSIRDAAVGEVVLLRYDNQRKVTSYRVTASDALRAEREAARVEGGE